MPHSADPVSRASVQSIVRAQAALEVEPPHRLVPGMHMADPALLNDFGVGADRRITSIIPDDRSYRVRWVAKQFEAAPERYRICTLRIEDPDDGARDHDRPLLNALGEFDQAAYDQRFDDFWAECGVHCDMLVGGNEVGAGPQTGGVAPEHDHQWIIQTEHMHDLAVGRNPDVRLAYCSIPNFAAFNRMMDPEVTTRLALHTRSIVAAVKSAARTHPERQYCLAFNLGQSGDLNAAFQSLVSLLDGTSIGAVFTEFRYPVDNGNLDTGPVGEFWRLAERTQWRDLSGRPRSVEVACYAPAEPLPQLQPAYRAKALVIQGTRTIWGDWFAGVCNRFNGQQAKQPA